MFRGTTPTNTFTSGIDLSEAAVVYLTYTQRGTVRIEKTKEDITFTSDPGDEHTPPSYTMTVVLTQEETLGLDETGVEIQVRARFADGTAVASHIVKTTAERILKDGEI